MSELIYVIKMFNINRIKVGVIENDAKINKIRKLGEVYRTENKNIAENINKQLKKRYKKSFEYYTYNDINEILDEIDNIFLLYNRRIKKEDMIMDDLEELFKI